MSRILAINLIILLPLFAQEFLEGVRAEDLELDRIESPSIGDTAGISDWRKFFFGSSKSVASPDGKLSVEFGHDGIWITEAINKTKRRIDDRGVIPKWSPNGDLIAYIKQKVRVGEFWRGHQLYGGYELWVYNMKENRKEKLTDSIAIDEFIWNRDGHYIVFTYESLVVKEESPLLLGVLNIANKEVKTIDTGSPYTNMGFSLSPDGSMVAYCKPLEWRLMTEWWVTKAEVFIANLDGTGKIKITNTESVEEMIKWSEDGKSLIVEQVGPTPTDFSFPRYVKIVLKKK